MAGRWRLRHLLLATVFIFRELVAGLESPEVRVAWLHQYTDRAFPIDARFIGCPDIFTVHGPRIGEDAAQVSAGVTVQFNPMVALYAHYDGIFGRDNYDSNAVSGGLSLSF